MICIDRRLQGHREGIIIVRLKGAREQVTAEGRASMNVKEVLALVILKVTLQSYIKRERKSEKEIVEKKTERMRVPEYQCNVFCI